MALIENKSDGETDTMKVIPCEHQLPQQREQVRFPQRSCHPLTASSHTGQGSLVREAG